MDDITINFTEETFSIEYEAEQWPAGIPWEQGIPWPVWPQWPQWPVWPAWEWDKTASLDFTNQSVVNFSHNLGKYPSVTVIDSAGDEVIWGIDHISINEVQASFIGSFTGKIICN